MDDETIDLVLDDDGSYTPKEKTKAIKPVKPKSQQVVKVRSRKSPTPKPQKKKTQMDDYFAGMDVGLEFLDNMSQRIDKLLNIVKR